MLEVPMLGKALAAVTSHHLDDLTDRVHSVLTVSLLILCAIFVGSKQHFGQPIQCMLPAHLDRGSWTAYGQYYCFVESTYRLSYNVSVPGEAVRTHVREMTGVSMNYYQWVPYFFVLQALCFFIPNWLWRVLQNRSVVDMQSMVDEAIVIRNELKKEERVKKLARLIEFITASFTFRDSRHNKRGLLGKMAPTDLRFYSTVIYLLSKLVALANDYLQIRLIGHFLGIDDIMWALQPFQLAKTVTRGDYSFSAQYFPRVTFCDLSRVTQGGVEKNTLQCVMMLNMINEKVFLLLWFWIVLVGAIAAINLVYTSLRLLQAGFRETTIRFYIQVAEMEEDGFLLISDRKRLRDFTNNVLGLDGVLLLNFVHEHAGAIVARDIVINLWRSFGASLASRSVFSTQRAASGGSVNCYSPVKKRTVASAPQISISTSSTVRSRVPQLVTSAIVSDERAKQNNII